MLKTNFKSDTLNFPETHSTSFFYSTDIMSVLWKVACKHIIIIMRVVRGASVSLHHCTCFDNTVTVSDTTSLSAAVSLFSEWWRPVAEQKVTIWFHQLNAQKSLVMQWISDCGTPPTLQHWPKLCYLWGRRQYRRELSVQYVMSQ